MTIRQIVKWSAPILTTEATGREIVTPEIIQDLKDTLRNEPRALGLSAHQIGHLCRAIVVRDENGGPLVMVKPSFTNPWGVSVMTEGCMSFPGLKQSVERASSGLVHWEDCESGHSHSRTYSGIPFRVIQHEIDHLNGVTLQIHRQRTLALELVRAL